MKELRDAVADALKGQSILWVIAGSVFAIVGAIYHHTGISLAGIEFQLVGIVQLIKERP